MTGQPLLPDLNLSGFAALLAESHHRSFCGDRMKTIFLLYLLHDAIRRQAKWQIDDLVTAEADQIYVRPGVCFVMRMCVTKAYLDDCSEFPQYVQRVVDSRTADIGI